MGRARRSWRSLLGVALVLAGIGVLGYLGWQYAGTNWVAERKHQQVTDELRGAWKDGVSERATSAGVAGAVIRIPRFGDDYEVPVLEGSSDTVLAAGFGHLEGTAEPGARGNYVISGHRVTHGEPLRGMPDLEVGDEILVETARAVHTYELTTGGDALSVPFTTGWVLEALPRNPDGGPQPDQRAGSRLLTLTTCAELFHTDHRLVAFGRLVDVEHKDA
ncbi:class E sortase [Nocardioides pantholopis]|uniref:class E sortase n=1 Tax=Nocardioides pantholopis TaxID=2483798 RepID=UPI001F1550AB|nr:class E sortase [Nocardioides pantholopis]